MPESSSSSRRIKIYYFFTTFQTILWIGIMLLIFWFSSKPAAESTQQSHTIDEIICQIVIRNFRDLTEYVKNNYIELIDKLVRKSAHFCEYMLFGFITYKEVTWVTFGFILPYIKNPSFSSINLKTESDPASNKKITDSKSRNKIFIMYTLASCIWCFIYACADEVHQYYVPGRYASFTDVLIDFSGALVGILIAFLFSLKKSNKKFS